MTLKWKNRNMEEKEEEGETSFGRDDLEDNPVGHNRSINIINTENPKSKFNRVKYIPDVKKDAGSIRRLITGDRKKSFKKIFDVTLEKKNGPNSSILLDKTVFVRDQKGNVSIIFKGEKIGNVNTNNEPELFTRKNKKYVDEFNDYMKKAKQEYKKTPRAAIEERIGDVDSETYGLQADQMSEVINSITNDSVLEIQTKIDNIIDENNLKKFIDNEQDPRWTLFERNELREFRGLVYLEDIDSTLSKNEKKEVIRGKIDGFDREHQHWKNKANLETAEPKKSIYKSFSEIAKLQADIMKDQLAKKEYRF